MTDGLRVLHAISSDRFAGVEQFVRRLAVRQAQDGHFVTVVGGAAEHMPGPLADAGVEWSPAATTVQVFRAMRRLLPASDVVNTHMTEADAATVAARALTRGAPPIVSTRHFAQRRGSRGPDAVYRMLDRRIDAEISISRAVAARIGVPSTVIHPGVEPAAPADAGGRRRTVLIAQRLQPEKHTDEALRAFALSGIATAGWTLEIAGTGPERDELEAAAVALGIRDAVHFLGFRTDLPVLMAESGILLASSPFEHFGLTVLESMSAGLPVVAAGAAGHAEMLSGIDDRLLFPPHDISGAADRLRGLAEDAEGRAEVGAVEQERQRRLFSLRAQADATERVYRAAIEAHGSRR